MPGPIIEFTGIIGGVADSSLLTLTNVSVEANIGANSVAARLGTYQTDALADPVSTTGVYALPLLNGGSIIETLYVGLKSTDDNTVVRRAERSYLAALLSLALDSVGRPEASGIAGTITTLDALDTAQDAQHATTQAKVDAVDDFVDTEVAAIKAKTDNLPSDPADASDIAAALATLTAYVDTEVAAIKAKTDLIPASPAASTDAAAAIVTYGLDHLVSAAVAGADVADNSIIAKLASKSATADWDSYVNTTDALEAIRDRGDAAWVTGSGTGTGARTVTITVNDGATAIQNARVRVTLGSDSYLSTTNASGQVTFNLDDGSWTVAISRSGYSYAGTTLVVDGTESVTYSMTAVAITPSDPGFVTGYLVARDADGNEESGVVIYSRATNSADVDGQAHSATWRSETSNGAGLVEFANLIPGVQYQFSRGDQRGRNMVLIPSDAEGTYELPSIIGVP